MHLIGSETEVDVARIVPEAKSYVYGLERRITNQYPVTGME